MDIQILVVLLCVVILTTFAGCYVVDPYPVRERRPVYREYRPRHYESDQLYCRGDRCWDERPYRSSGDHW